MVEIIIEPVAKGEKLSQGGKIGIGKNEELINIT